MSRSAKGDGLQSATWDCPQTSIAKTDAIVVKVYARIVDQVDWTLQAEFITEQLESTQLDDKTWTVYYYTKYDTLTTGAPGGRYTRGWYYWGTSTYDSKIENFSHSVPEFSNFAVVITLLPLIVLAMMWVRKRRAVVAKKQEKLLEADKLQRK